MNNANSTNDAFAPQEDEEELVAYLDGELDDAGCQQVERRLASDAAYRERLGRLQLAWDCLDRLPETSVDEGFTRTTIEMVALDAVREIEQSEQKLPRVRRRRQVLTVLLLLGSLLGGFMLVAALRPDPNRQLVRDLPILENLDQYRYVENVKFLRDLGAADVLPPSSPVEEAAENVTLPPRTEESYEGRTRWIAKLPDEAKTYLLNRQERFVNLSRDEQQRIRHLAEELEVDPQADELNAVLEQYHHWLMSLSPGERADLLRLEGGPARIERIERMVREEQQQRSRRLSDEDRKVVMDWLGATALAYRERIMSGVPQGRLQEFMRLPVEQQKALLIAMAWRKSRFSPNSPMAALDADEIKQLTERLSPEAQANLRLADTPDKQKKLIAAWIQFTISQQSIFSRAFGHKGDGPSREELETFFDEGLNSDQRAELLALPANEMERELRRLYFQGNGPPQRPEPPFSRPHGFRDGPPRDGFRGGHERDRERKP